MNLKAGGAARTILVLGGENRHRGVWDGPLFHQVSADPLDGSGEAPQAAVVVVITDLVHGQRLNAAVHLCRVTDDVDAVAVTLV